MRQILRAFTLLVLLCLLYAPGGAQSTTDPSPPADASVPGTDPQVRRRRPGERTHEEEVAELEKRQAKARNKERFAKLKKDTDELLQLATELKKYVDQANENTLSLEVIRKAEEIEKLARSVREKMKGQ